MKLFDLINLLAPLAKNSPDAGVNFINTQAGVTSQNGESHTHHIKGMIFQYEDAKSGEPINAPPGNVIEVFLLDHNQNS